MLVKNHFFRKKFLSSLPFSEEAGTIFRNGAQTNVAGFLRRLDQLKAEPLVFIIPTDFDKHFLEKRFLAYGDKHGFHFIPTLDRFIEKREEYKPQVLVYKRDQHLTTMGHQVLFEILMESDLFSSQLPTSSHPPKLEVSLKIPLPNTVP